MPRSGIDSDSSANSEHASETVRICGAADADVRRKFVDSLTFTSAAD